MDENTVEGTYGKSGTYLKWEDLDGQDWEMIIDGWEKREMDQTDFETGEKYKAWKVILSLAGEDRKVVVNKTNATAISAAYGSRFEDWIGKTIILFVGDWKGKGCLRVRTPKVVKKVAPKQKYDERNPPPSDEIPF
jgi:hypothetical protein